jgi:translation elongation factor EF-1alpha
MDHTIPEPWNAARFYRIEEETKSFLMNQCSFPENAIRVIPVSGLSGENLLSLSEECLGKQWYAGMSLEEGLETFFQPPPRLVAQPFRGIISSLKPLHHAEYEVETQIMQGKLRTHCSIGLLTYSSGHCQHDVVTVQHMKRASTTSNSGFEDIAVGYAGEKVIIKIAPK